ncbi:hypothetical protein M8C21_001738 [Ambrosia artemisiifolia]|uniref:DUF3475 domain-containing protein n=1 Tax=Ambrosia artemisiifolia TaxID=4212 RepID=A0AAD5D2D1_AMBAR|nr:hypothetical protein M8C21_001738 [Ambrosia artemisiifolia]
MTKPTFPFSPRQNHRSSHRTHLSSTTTMSSSGITREFIFDFPPPRRNMRDKLSVLAFEVANTIVKGLNLRQSLLDGNIQILKKEILHTKGVQLLVSTDIEELLRIAAADKREEFEVFCREVARFGNMCTDPQLHNLDRLFASNFVIKERREMTDIIMPKLVNLAQHTVELYHECISLDRYEQHYRRTLEDVESFRKSATSVIQHEINRQRKMVRNLQKKSLWSRNLKEVMEMLVYVVNSILKAFTEAFGENALIPTNKDDETYKKTNRLGVSGLALHYANLITQIAEIMTMPQIKAEMDKILHWLVPVATNTIKAHQSFGWFGEWANTG